MPALSDPPAARPEGAPPLPEGATPEAAAADGAAQQAKLAALGRLAGGMVHDFNNLLAVIQSGVSLIERARGGDAALAPVLGALRDAARRGQGLTQRLLALTHDAAPRRERIDVGARLRDQAAWLGRLLGSRIRLVADLPEGLRPVDADPERLELAVLDLCLDLRDTLPDGGTITIGARHAGDGVAIAVAGSGAPGGARARRDSALGRARSFAAEHGGTLTLDAAGAGTQVVLHLPAARDTA